MQSCMVGQVHTQQCHPVKAELDYIKTCYHVVGFKLTSSTKYSQLTITIHVFRRQLTDAHVGSFARVIDRGIGNALNSFLDGVCDVRNDLDS